MVDDGEFVVNAREDFFGFVVDNFVIGLEDFATIGDGKFFDLGLGFFVIAKNKAAENDFVEIGFVGFAFGDRKFRDENAAEL